MKRSDREGRRPSRFRPPSPLLGLLVALGVLLVTASSASAAVALSVGPNIPSPNGPVTVGTTGVPSSLTITNTSDDAQGTLNVTVDPNSITLVPSCGTIPATPDCPAASADPGVFSVSATGTGAAGTACAGTTFTITKIDVTQDKYVLSPSTPVVLGAGNTGGPAARCTINFTVNVLKVPTKDARADPGTQTDELAGVTATASDNQRGSGFGTNFTTVNRATPTVATAVSPTPIALGGTFHDTATLTGNGVTAPRGTVLFNVFGPNDTNCSGPVAFTSTNVVSTSAGVTTATSGNFTPQLAGAYRVIAQYSGDAIYAPVTTACGDAGELETVSPGTPTVTTAVAPTPIALGGAFHDTATLTGSGVAPTGTVDFTVFGPNDTNCNGPAAFTSPGNAVSTAAGVTTATMPNFTPTLAGTYRVVAHYSGDANYSALTTACGAANETETIMPATPSLATAVSPTPIALGGAFHDTATLTGTGAVAPTGTVDFTVFGPNDAACAGAAAFTSTGNAVSTTAGVTTATMPNFTPTKAGTYNVVAHYSGDANYTPVTTACGAANETETITPGTPAVATAVSPNPIVLGAPFHDTATLTGSGVAPTGTVDFTVFGPNDTNCNGPAAFTSTGNPVSTTGGVTTATMANFTPTLAGTYRVIAHYSGDANYTALTTACGAANETETVSPMAPTVTTAVAPTPIALGGSFHDTATLTGSGAPPTGTVDFTVFGPNDTNCAGTAAFTSTGRPVTTAAGVTTATMASFTPTRAGSYNVVAHYSGDANYTALTTACGAANETETVSPVAPTVATAVAPTPIALGGAFHDTATVTGNGATAPTGTVDFTVFGPGDATCAGAAAFSSAGNALATTGGVTTATMPSFTPTRAGAYNVVAHYSGDGDYTALTTACGAANETETISPATPAITTAVAPTPVAFGQPFHDTATITGTGTTAPTGTVDFSVFGPGNASCTGTPTFTSLASPVSTTAGVTTATSLNFTPTQPGAYNVIAHYGGDANYAAVTGACGAANETATVTAPTPMIGVTKAANPTSRPVPGGDFTFTVVVNNPSTNTPVTITQLVDNIYGNLATRAASTCGAVIGVTLAPGMSTSPCTFTGPFTGVAGASQTDTVTVTGMNGGVTVTATAMATVTLTPAPPSAPMIGVTKVASPLSRVAPGGTFTFTVAVSNPSTTTPVTITQLVDNIYGNLATRAGSTCGALIGVTLAPGATSAPCSFSGPFSGSAGAAQTDTVTVTGTNNGATVSATAHATVTLTAPASAAVSPVSLHSPAACVTKPFTVYVSGEHIATVVYYLDGHRIKTVSKRDSQGRLSVTINPAPLTRGRTHRLTAVVEPVPHSGQPLRTVRRTFAVCGSPALPRFTG